MRVADGTTRHVSVIFEEEYRFELFPFSQQVMRYLNRLSGPFLDRFDLSIEVPLLPQGSLQNTGDRGETSQQVREKVLKR